MYFIDRVCCAHVWQYPVDVSQQSDTTGGQIGTIISRYVVTKLTHCAYNLQTVFC